MRISPTKPKTQRSINGGAVLRLHQGKPLKRQGRGFSMKELKAANITYDHARRLGISVDLKRRTKHDFNLNTLERLLGKGQTVPAPVIVAAETE